MGHVLQATDLHYVYVVKKTKQSPAMRDDPYSAPPYVEYKVGHSCNPENRVNSSSAGDKYIGDVLYLAFCVSSDKGERKRLATSLEANIVRELHTCGYQVEGGEPNTEVEVFTCGGKKEPNEITRVIERGVENDPDFKLVTITNPSVRQLEWTCEPTPGYCLTRANGNTKVTVASSGARAPEVIPVVKKEKRGDVRKDFWREMLQRAPSETMKEKLQSLLDDRKTLREDYNYVTALSSAVEGRGLKLKTDIKGPPYYGENDCLIDKPLDIFSLESVQLWIREAKKLDAVKTKALRKSYAQGALHAALSKHLMRIYDDSDDTIACRKRRRVTTA